MNLENLDVQEMSALETKEVNGGEPISVALAIAAIAIGYCCWAASFCYSLGKD